MGIQTRIVRADAKAAAAVKPVNGKNGKQGAAGAAGVAGSFVYTDLELPDAAAITPNCDYGLNWTVNTGSGGLTVNNPIGTPLGNDHKLTLRVKATQARPFTWDTDFRGSDDTPLPTALSGSGKTDRYGFAWNAQDSVWDYVAFNRGYE